MPLHHNSYFDAGIQSIGFERGGSRQSVCVMDAGEYTFDTAAPERVTVIQGELVVRGRTDKIADST